MNLAPIIFLPGHSKEKTKKETPTDALIMNNLESLLAITLYNAPGNTSEAIVEIFIKPRASTMFEHPVYSLDGPGLSMEVLGPHERF